MFRFAVLIFLFTLACNPKVEVEKTPQTTKQKVEKNALPEQSVKEAVQLLCEGAHKKEGLRTDLQNSEVLAVYNELKSLKTSKKKERLERLLDQAKVGDCAYQSYLVTELEKERAALEIAKPLPFEEVYLGDHALRVNRINASMTKGRATIIREGSDMILEASVKKGKHRLALKGKVIPKSAKVFTLEGELKGVPDLSWRNVRPREQVTKGKFVFKATKGRKFWRLYRVNGKGCVCDDNCGNDFCYIDIRPEAKSK